ncbi:MAG: 1-deoxy-D-xylulose-5-phosphate reductoisomerase [Clostridia bacterium]|nr:1-deoxy-D-xylulose-5-phosphate reductoisomerase [Clostridia bacterium]MBQ8303840.1 1-deoxy-D-xylulose-5-phosphate reductoisomerase [Clostridia bacterium]
MEKSLIILGSTGSIGTQSLTVARQNGWRVTGLAAGSNVDLIEQQVREFKPLKVALFSEEAARDLKARIADTDTAVLSGISGVCEVAESEGDLVLNAIVGIAGLRPTVAALKAGKQFALANKETLVTGGSLVMGLAREKGIKILPVDSEHSAIFQSLQGAPENSLKKILLTASGGPFYSKTREELGSVTVEQALKHPNWSMGAKITIDSATLMNKGLEVIEAVHLFGVKADDIEVLVHRQSILHSAVELVDGAVIGQLGTPDMKVPIQYALTYPERANVAYERLSLADIGTLTFAKPDTETFKCLRVCIDAINRGGLVPAAANGANEEAVRLFLDRKISFLQIGDLVEAAAANQKAAHNYTIEDVFEADRAAREFVISHFGG